MEEPKSIILKVIKGRILINTELIGEMDPYVEVFHNGKVYKTPYAKNGG